jgi:hypothetical protein
MKVSLPSKDGYFYSICYAFGVVNFPRNALVSFARNGWSACAGMEWSHSSESPHWVQLLQISVVQRMKANHNFCVRDKFWPAVVANISCSKNESKSQLAPGSSSSGFGCCKYQLFKE